MGDNQFMDDESKNFKITFGNYSYTGSASDPVEAATNFLEKENPSSLPYLIDVSECDNEENRFFVYTPLVLSNMGKHKQSSDMMKSINEVFK
jgi:hypothetical protein